MFRKTLGINGCRGNNQLEIGSLWQQLFQVAQQKINIQTALMGFINNNRVILIQKRIILGFGQQDAVGH